MAVSHWLVGVHSSIMTRIGRDLPIFPIFFFFLKTGDIISRRKNVLPCQNNSYLISSCWWSWLQGVTCWELPFQGSWTPFSVSLSVRKGKLILLWNAEKCVKSFSLFLRKYLLMIWVLFWGGSWNTKKSFLSITLDMEQSSF